MRKNKEESLVVAEKVRSRAVERELKEIIQRFLHKFLCILVWVLAFTLSELQNQHVALKERGKKALYVKRIILFF